MTILIFHRYNIEYQLYKVKIKLIIQEIHLILPKF
jgi:hypothetical protein